MENRNRCSRLIHKKVKKYIKIIKYRIIIIELIINNINIILKYI